MKLMSNINRIIFYGCSFTAGSELSDLELFPDLTQEEITKLKITEGYSFYNRIENKRRVVLDNQLAWPNWFCNELNLNITYINRAVPGSSMSQIIFDIENDIVLGNITSDDVIIVGITSPERMCIFNNEGPRSLIFNDLDLRWDDHSFRDAFLNNIASDDYILYNWYKDIKYLDMLSDRLNGQLFQQWVWASYNEQLEFHNDGVPLYNLSDYMTHILNTQFNILSIIDNNMSFTKLNAWYPENKHEFNHPKLHIQKQFGVNIANAFKKNIIT